MEFFEEDDEDCQYSCLLILSALTQLIVYTITIVFTIQSFQDGSMIKQFEVEEALLITFFQIFSICFGGYALISFTEKAWKASYGYGDLYSTKLKSIFAGISSLIFLIIATLFAVYRWPAFEHHGLYFLLDGLTCLFYFIIFIRRFQLINEFVHDLLHANGMHLIPINEQHAHTLYRLQECEREVRSYINSTRYGPFRRHAYSFRHSEFYRLHRWIAQIERFVCSSEPKRSIMALVREMHERARVLKIGAEDQEHYKQLAALPFIFMPIKDNHLEEFEDQV